MCRCSLKRPFFAKGIETVASHFLLYIPTNHFLQSRIIGRFSFLHCMLHIQFHVRFQLLRVMQLFLAQVFKDMAVSHLFGGPTRVKHGTNDWANKGLRREVFPTSTFALFCGMYDKNLGKPASHDNSGEKLGEMRMSCCGDVSRACSWKWVSCFPAIHFLTHRDTTQHTRHTTARTPYQRHRTQAHTPHHTQRPTYHTHSQTHTQTMAGLTASMKRKVLSVGTTTTLGFDAKPRLRLQQERSLPHTARSGQAVRTLQEDPWQGNACPNNQRPLPLQPPR